MLGEKEGPGRASPNPRPAGLDLRSRRWLNRRNLPISLTMAGGARAGFGSDSQAVLKKEGVHASS